MPKTFFICCTHFGHNQIIKYENRPFDDTNEMDKQLINNWNNTIKGDDIVWHCGDIAFGNTEYVRNILKRLKGRKRLIRGNHDAKSDTWYRNNGFEEVYKYPIILDKFWYLSHAPLLYINENMPVCNIHGHIHSRTVEGKNHFNVCVEKINYTPISFDEIKKVVCPELVEEGEMKNEQ